MQRAVIIDDVPAAIENLKGLIKDYCPSIDIVATAPGVVEGIKCIKKENPDILFLDIEMPDGTGFDLLEIIGEFNFKLIFTTGRDDFAIKAFRFSAIDYLLKPIDPDDLMSAVKKASEGSSQSSSIQLLQENIKNNQPTRLALHTQERIEIVQINEITRLEAEGNYTTFHLMDKSKVLVSKTLKEYDQLLKECNFIRVHQSHLVNKALIKAYVKTEGGYLLMIDDTRVPVSVRKKQEVVKALEE